MIFSPKKTPKKAAVITVLLYVASAGALLCSRFLAPRLPYQLIALVCAAIAIYLTSRYLLTDYKYAIKDAERASDKIAFSIIKVNGKRENVMANFDLISVYAFEKCAKVSAFEKKYGKVDKFYNYTSNLGSPLKYMLAMEFNGMKVLFVIEADEEFAREITARIPEDSYKSDSISKQS